MAYFMWTVITLRSPINMVIKTTVDTSFSYDDYMCKWCFILYTSEIKMSWVQIKYLSQNYIVFFCDSHVKAPYAVENLQEKENHTPKRIFNHSLYSIPLEYHNALNFPNRVAHSIQDILRKKKNFQLELNFKQFMFTEHFLVLACKWQKAKKRLFNFSFTIFPTQFIVLQLAFL